MTIRQIQGWIYEEPKDTYMRFLVLLCLGFSPVLRFFMIRISSSPLDIHLLKTVEWGRHCWKRYQHWSWYQWIKNIKPKMHQMPMWRRKIRPPRSASSKKSSDWIEPSDVCEPWQRWNISSLKSNFLQNFLTPWWDCYNMQMLSVVFVAAFSFPLPVKYGEISICKSRPS